MNVNKVLLKYKQNRILHKLFLCNAFQRVVMYIYIYIYIYIIISLYANEDNFAI